MNAIRVTDGEFDLDALDFARWEDGRLALRFRAAEDRDVCSLVLEGVEAGACWAKINELADASEVLTSHAGAAGLLDLLAGLLHGKVRTGLDPKRGVGARTYKGYNH